jgi:hypothetical protein
MDLVEFDDVHPMLKELYQEAIIKGIIPFYSNMLNELIKTNDIDKWYNANKKDIMELIKTLRTFADVYMKGIVTSGSNKIDPSTKALLHSFKIKDFTEKWKTVIAKTKAGEYDTPTLEIGNDLRTLDKLFGLISENIASSF